MTRKISKEDLLEKIVADYTRRIRSGKAPSISAYQDKYPELAVEIEDLLASVAMIEGLKLEANDQNKESNELDLTQLRQLGDYLLIREVGRGGMGVVFEAVHQSLGRRVAVKVMRRRDIDDEKYIARFRREAQSAAKLHHTNIVSVFGVGEANGFHYYVMEFIDGAGLNQVVQSLTRRLSGPTIGPPDTSVAAKEAAVTRIDGTDKPTLPNHSSTLELREPELSTPSRIPQGNKRFKWLAQVGTQVADALAHAHGQGILHRDVKPANLLLDRKDQVWITDFGLVKETELDGLTKTGDLVGTPQYMAPESFKGNYDQRSETYCLGLTLYELATLRPAFDPGTTAELIHRITTTTPTSPRKIDPKIPYDLNTIIEKSIAREPEQRYATASDLRDDLRAFLEDRPISARKPSTFEQAWRWGRRNPLPATLSLLSMLLLFAFSAAVTFGWMSTSAAYKKLEKEAELTEEARKLAVKNEETAKENEKKIQIQFERAESNLALIIQAFDEMFKQIISPGDKTKLDIDGFQGLGGIETAVSADDAEFLKQMMVYYEQIAEQNSGNEKLIFESARAFRRIANINYLVGETRSAIEAYRNALEFYEPMLTDSPESVSALLYVVNTRGELAAALRRNGQFDDARDEVKKNIETIEAHPNSNLPEVQLALAQSLTSAGSWYVDLAAVENTSDLFELTETSEARPANRDRYARRRQWVDRHAKEFLKDTLRSIDIGKQLLIEDPENPDYQMLLGKTYSCLAALQLRAEHPDAVGNLKEALKQFAALGEAYPENLKYQYLLAVTFLMYPVEEANKESKQQVDNIINMSNELVEKSPNPDYKQLGILAYAKLAGLHLSSNDLNKAVEDQKRAANLLIELDRQVGNRQEFFLLRNLLAKNYRAIISAYEQDDNRREAGRVREYARLLLAGEISRERGPRRGGGGRPPRHFRDGRNGREGRDGPPPPRDDGPPFRNNGRPFGDRGGPQDNDQSE